MKIQSAENMLSNGDTESAVKELEKAQSEIPELEDSVKVDNGTLYVINYDLGRAYIDLSFKEPTQDAIDHMFKAIELFEDASKADPRNPDAYSQKGHAYVRIYDLHQWQGNYLYDAIDAYSKALEKGYNDEAKASTNVYIGNVYRKLADYEGLKSDDPWETRTNRYEQAIIVYDRALELDPYNEYAYSEKETAEKLIEYTKSFSK